MFRKNKNQEQPQQQDRRYRVSGKTNSYTYRSSRSVREREPGRYTREEQEARSVDDRNRIAKNMPYYIAILIVLVLLIYSILLQPTAQIKIVGAPSTSFIQSTSVYQQYANKILRSSYLNDTKLTINADSSAAQVTKEFPELSGVSVVIPLTGNKPVFEIRPAQSVIILSNSQGKFMINQNGAAMVKLDTQQKLEQYNLPVVTDDSGLNVTLGEQVLPIASISFINTVISQFNAKSIQIQSMTLSTTPYELDIQVRGEPYYIKFNLLSDANYSIGTYLATVKQLATLKQTPSQYIDVRIPGRAYYK